MLVSIRSAGKNTRPLWKISMTVRDCASLESSKTLGHTNALKAFRQQIRTANASD